MEILLVEDTPADAELAMIAARRCGFVGSVVHVPDGGRALEWLEQRGLNAEEGGLPPPRLVLLDLKMPRIDGLEVLRRVKASPRLRRVPIVVFTSSREERDLARAFDQGANSYVVKPVEFGAYCDAMAQVLSYWTKLSEEPSYAAID